MFMHEAGTICNEREGGSTMKEPRKGELMNEEGIKRKLMHFERASE